MNQTRESTMMTSEKKAHFKRLLSRMFRELSEDGSRKMMETDLSHERFPDPVDQAIADRERGIRLSIRERDRDTIAEILEALDKIRTGTYGICELCEGKTPLRGWRPGQPPPCALNAREDRSGKGNPADFTIEFKTNVRTGEALRSLCATLL